jgi:hypothetical protein
MLDEARHGTGVAMPAHGRSGEPPAIAVSLRGARTRLLQDLDGFTAIALRLTADPDSDAPVELLLMQGDARSLSMGLHDPDEVLALWRAIAARSGLPLVVIDETGAQHALFPQIGRLALGRIRTRRCVRFLGDRRPRFHLRRATTALPRRPHVWAGREISSAGH